MFRSWLAVLLVAAVMASPALAGVHELAKQPVWPRGAPPVPGWPGAQPMPVKPELRENGERLYNVTEPTLQAFLPDRAKATGAAVVVAPGGGFRLLAVNHEGTRVARWLADHGIAAFVLNYRLIQTPPGETEEGFRQRAQAVMPGGIGGIPGVADGLEALRIVRANALQWGIDPARVGIMGFSAGGHVAGMAMFASEADRPAFAGLIYGMPFADPMPPIPAANLPFPPGTPAEPWLQPRPVPAPGRLPPMFLAMAQDDLAVGLGMRKFYDQVYAAGYRPEFHLFEKGGHGFGMKQHGNTTDHWIEEFLWWLDSAGMLAQSRAKG